MVPVGVELERDRGFWCRGEKEAGEDLALVAGWERQDTEVALPELPAAPWSISPGGGRGRPSSGQPEGGTCGTKVGLCSSRQKTGAWRRSVQLRGGQRLSQNVADVSAALPCASPAWPGTSGMLGTPSTRGGEAPREDVLSSQGLRPGWAPRATAQGFPAPAPYPGSAAPLDKAVTEWDLLPSPWDKGTAGVMSCPSHLMPIKIPISGHCFPGRVAHPVPKPGF